MCMCVAIQVWVHCGLCQDIFFFTTGVCFSSTKSTMLLIRPPSVCYHLLFHVIHLPVLATSKEFLPVCQSAGVRMIASEVMMVLCVWTVGCHVAHC